jgi:hypothetical protein
MSEENVASLKRLVKRAERFDADALPADMDPGV